MRVWLPQNGRPRAEAIVVDQKSFALNGRTCSYRFHVDEDTGDLITDHFGGKVSEVPVIPDTGKYVGLSKALWYRREFPDLGRGDFRSPAIRIRHDEGHTVSQFQYQSHTLIDGKPRLHDLPSTYGDDTEAQTVIIHMYDKHSQVGLDLSYSIFPEHDSIARSVRVVNNGTGKITIDKLASFSTDFPHAEYDMLGLRGEWARECAQLRRRVDFGTQAFGSSTGYSSHYHNPFLALASPHATESQGQVWAFSLVYSGSFTAEVEKSPQGFVRTLIGFNDHQLSWPLLPGQHLTSPECVAVFSDHGVGGISRRLHRLYRQHLIRSQFVHRPRPALLNSWEGVYFTFDQNKILNMAKSAADLGIKLFVMDDGWFGVKYPRVNSRAGLGDWTPNPDRFPNGLRPVVEAATNFSVANTDEKLQFGIWVEPEMVNPKSELFERHPDWVLRAGSYAMTEERSQLALNLSLTAVQDYIIDSITTLLQSAPISYVKWDNNRGLHEVPSPKTYHGYMLGLYRVFDVLTGRFPAVLWEGCASGGGRFDPGILHYFPQFWVSDNTDAVDRIAIQFGTSVAYPASCMGCHISDVPNHTTKRTTSLAFRAHVAMMGGSFGFELDPTKLSQSDREQIPTLVRLAERVSPIVIDGDMWKLSLPSESKHPAVIYVSRDGNRAVLFAFQMVDTPVISQPNVTLQGLDSEATYLIDGSEKAYSGATLMNIGLQFVFDGDHDSRVIFLEKV